MIKQNQTLFQLIKHQGNIYTNFRPYPFPEKPTKKVRALILGYCGNGKTNFLNRMSGKSYKTGFSRGSLTKDIAYQDCFYLPQGALRIYDTPGTNSRKQTMMHALVLRRTLQTLPLDLILLQSKLSSRFEEDTIIQLKKQSLIFEGYQKNLIFLISHLDIISTKSQQQKKQFVQQFNICLKQNKIKTKIIMYSNLNSDFKKITDILYTIGQSNQKVQVKIENSKFFKYFNLAETNLMSQNQLAEQCINQIKDVAKSYLQYASGIPIKDPNNDDMIAQLKVQMKQELKAIQNRQYKLYSQRLSSFESTDLYLLLSQNIHAELERLDLITQPKLRKQSYFELKNIFYDVRDLLKKCNHCGLIWMRVEGCTGETSCGGRPVQFDVFDKKKLYKYKFQRVGERLQKQAIQQKNIGQQDYARMLAQRQKTKNSQLKGTQGVGCNKIMYWNQLPRLQNIQQILKQMYNISNFEQIQNDYNRMMIETKQMQRKLDQKLNQTDQILWKSMR